MCYTSRDDVKTGWAFEAKGIQTSAGVPLQCGEGAGFKTFRIGLFGIDKLKDVDGTVRTFKEAVEAIVGK